MGNSYNGTLTGQQKMDLLEEHKRLSDQYKGKKWEELTAADQFEIGLSADKLELDLKSVQPSSPVAEETQETGTDQSPSTEQTVSNPSDATLTPEQVKELQDAGAGKSDEELNKLEESEALNEQDDTGNETGTGTSAVSEDERKEE